MTENENQQIINELRREILDGRANTINRWLTVVAIVLTFFAVVVAIAGFLGFSSFQEIKIEARSSVEEMKVHLETANQLIEKIKQNRDISDQIVQNNTDAERVYNDPEVAKQVVKDIRKNPEATLIDRVIADAVSLQEKERWSEAIEKRRVIANIAKGYDNELAAREWFSIGYLIHLSGKDPEDILSAYDQAIRLNPDFAKAYNNRGVAKNTLERYNDAITDFDEAIRLNPDNAKAYNNRGVAKHGLGQNNDAITDYNEAIRLNPDFAKAYNNRGVVKAALGRPDDAITDYDEAIRLNPDNAEAYNNRGNAKHTLGRNNDAITDFDEAIRLKPDYATAYYNRGNAKYTLGRLDDAITDYDEAIRLKPDYAKAYDNRGFAKGSLGQYDDAITDFDEAIRLNPDFTKAYNNRGVAKKALDPKNEARQDFKTPQELVQ